MCTDKDYEKNFELYSPFLYAGMTCIRVMCHYCAVGYFQC